MYAHISKSYMHVFSSGKTCFAGYPHMFGCPLYVWMPPYVWIAHMFGCPLYVWTPPFVWIPSCMIGHPPYVWMSLIPLYVTIHLAALKHTQWGSQTYGGHSNIWWHLNILRASNIQGYIQTYGASKCMGDIWTPP